MRILHYIHGLPPVKVGGLIRYAVDLAIGQAENGQETILLFPGPIALKKASVSIKRWKRWRNSERIRSSLLRLLCECTLSS